MDLVVRRLEREFRLPFSALFTPPFTRGRLIGLFLAVLELTKVRRLIPEQPDAFGDIWLSLAPPADPDPTQGPEAGRAPEPSASPPDGSPG
jgi:chromatin segregation and condensation protein Rec8/ScpA/Scc1 (kleisin family)